MRIIRNLFRSIINIALIAILGYVSYNHTYEGPHLREINLGINAAFVVLGMLLVLSWARKTKKQSEQLSEALSLRGTATDAESARSRGKTGKRT